MSDYDNQYYFIRKPKKEAKFPFLVPDTNTESRRYRFERQPLESPPLVFGNGNNDVNRRTGIVSVTPDILFAGADLVVRSSVRDQLLAYDIPNLSMHPAVYIDDNDVRHDDYFYLTFTEDFDCWDRTTSEYDDEDPIDSDDEELVEVYSYRLNGTLLDSTPLAQRRLFKMGDDLNGYPCCHEELRPVFDRVHSGAWLVRLSDQ